MTTARLSPGQVLRLLVAVDAIPGVELREEERCPQCGGPMDLVAIDGHASWACPVDAYAYRVDYEEEDDHE